MFLINNVPAVANDYSAYTEVAFYPGPIPDTTSRWYEFPLDPPVCGRYLVVQRSAANDGTNNILEIAEAEAYTNTTIVVN